MQRDKIFATVIESGVSSPLDIRRDLAALLSTLRNNDAAEANNIETLVKAHLAGNVSALALVNDIRSDSLIPGIKRFGPVLSTDLVAAERLALLTDIGSSLRPDFEDVVVEFVEKSVELPQNDLLSIFKVAARVQDLLGETTVGRRWRRNVIPALLQKLLEQPLLLADFTVAASGGLTIPSGWEEIEQWVSEWDNFREKSPSKNFGVDGFFEVQPNRPDSYLPAAINPLELRILRRKFLNSLNSAHDQTEIRAFSLWLVDHTFNGPTLIEGVPLECVFAAGALIVALSINQGVTVSENGQISAADPSNFWEDLLERVLRNIVINSELSQLVPHLWQGQQDRIRNLIDLCPDWHTAPTILNLRSRAEQRFVQSFQNLETVLIAQSDRLLDSEFNQEAELIVSGSLPELRPSQPISSTAAVERNNYSAKLEGITKTISSIESEMQPVVKDISRKALDVRTGFDARLASPFAELAFPSLTLLDLEEPDRNLPLVAFFKKSMAALDLGNRIIRDGSEVDETFPTWGAWIDSINRQVTDSNRLQAWANLEIWDELRGRLAGAKKDTRDFKVAKQIRETLPWLIVGNPINPPDGVSTDSIRPRVAAIAHLGVEVPSDFVAHLETVLTNGTLTSPLQSLLAAMRLEIGLTAISRQTEPSNAFGQFETPTDPANGLSRFVAWIKDAFDSDMAWESRVGMNALILLARLAADTGDLFLYSALESGFNNIEIAKKIVAQAISIFLSDSSSTNISGLPLALAAFDLNRYARLVVQTVKPDVITEPIWLEDVENPSSLDINTGRELIDALANRFIAEHRNALKDFIAEGGVASKVFLLVIFEIKLNQLKLEQQLTVKPLRRKPRSTAETQLKHNSLLSEIRGLQRTVRSIFCKEQLLLQGLAPRVETIFIRGPIQVGETWEIHLDSQTVAYTATEVSIKNVLEGLVVAWNSSDISPVSAITASNSTPGVDLKLDTFEANLGEQQIGILDLSGPFSSNFSLEVSTNSTQGEIRRVPASSDLVPWWQTRYWSNLLTQNENNLLEDSQTFVPFDLDFQIKMDEGTLPDTLKTALGLGNQVQVQVRVQRSGESWLIHAQPLIAGQNSEIFQIQRSKANPAIFSVHKNVSPPINLFNWASSFHSTVESNLLNLAATLESSIPIALDESSQDVNGQFSGIDVDGRFEGEFPELSWKVARERLAQSINTLKKTETNYSEALDEQIDAKRTDEIIDLLKKPLILNTADYQEQMQAAIAEVRAAEAELEVAEFESLATEFEVFASELVYDAAQVEIERQSALEEISKLDEEVAKLNTKVVEIDKELATGTINQIERDVQIALNKIEQANIRAEQANRARTSILGEIKLLRQLLGLPGPGEPNNTYEVTVQLPDGSEVQANGQIAAMAIKIESTILKQLNEDLSKAEGALKTAKDKERERKKKAKRRRLVRGICRFVGAVVGTIVGGPAGAALGAEIGGAIGELTNGIIDNKPPEEILVGLIDNGFAIAQASGFNLEKEINLLGAKTANEINDFIGQLDSSIETILDDLPNIIDEQLLQDTLEVLGLEEVPELVDLLGKSYKELKEDVNNLGSIGTELKTILRDAGTEDPIGFGDSRELLRRLTDKLFKNTQNNVKQIENLGRAIGEEIEDLSTPEKQREVALRIAEKFGKLVVTQISQETSAYRREAIAQWIRFKREITPEGTPIWNDVVKREAEQLVKELFPDGKTQSEILANMESSLIDPNLIRGKIQVLLVDWQQELDTRLSQIIAIDQNAPKPSTAVQAAQASVNYLRQSIGKFNSSLLPWLKGENNKQRDQLLIDLDQKLKDDLESITEIKVLEIDEANARLNAVNAQTALQMAESELERVGNLFEISKINEAQSVLKTKVIKLAKIRESNIATAKDNSRKAAIERNNASKARIKARRFDIESREALSEATARRGAEASKIRSMLSQPPLVESDLSAGASARLRVEHAQTLNEAFKAYRELLRYYQAAGVNKVDKLIRPDEQPFSTWSKSLEDWLSKIGDEFQDRSGIVGPIPITWELTPEQIASLFTPEGFRVIIGPQANEAPLLFSVGNELKPYLISDSVADSPWISKFIQHGVQISNNITSKSEGGSNFTITDNSTSSVPVIFFNEDSPDEKWQISGENKTYSVEVTSSELNIKRRQEPIAIGRSPYSNRYQDLIDGNQAQTGRIACVILDAVISGTTQKISESDYTIKVKHLGDRWLNQQNIKLHRVRELHEQRAIWLDSGESIDDAWKKIREFAASEGDPEPFSVQGFPVSGTLMIRLEPKSERQFDKVTLTVLYKHFSS